jgi:hypothetical protein
MKKTLWLTGAILLLMALSFTSCEDDKTPKELLIGMWDMESDHFTYYEDGVKVDEETYDYDPGEGAISILEDGTGKIYEDGDVSDTFTWEVSGDILTISQSGEDDMEMDFSVSESKLTLKYSYEETWEGVVYKSEMELILSR